jgi:hypothetical protein
MTTDGLSLQSPPQGKYLARLGRAAGMLGLGVLMHLPSAAGPGVPAPASSPRPFVKVNAQQADAEAPAVASDRPAVIVTHTLVFAGSANAGAVLETNRRTVDAPVGTAGVEQPSTAALAAFDPPPRATDSGTESAAEEANATAVPETSPVPAVIRPLPAIATLPAHDSTGPSPQTAGTPSLNVTAPPLSRVPPIAVAARTISEEELVRQLLNEYTEAFERLDVRAQKALYPTVDSKALQRRYEQITSQRLTLGPCGITVSGSTANARCRGSATYQPRIGTRPVQIASREWTFDLSKQDTSWRIVNTYVR